MNTYATKEKDIKRAWHLVDAKGKVLGRMATQVAHILKGKHKPIYTPNLDTGDHVVIINAAEVRLTGNKLKQKTYYHHSGYPGGLKAETAGKLMETKPEKVVMKAVRGMLPKNSLGRKMLCKLRVYAGPTHEQQAQQPVPKEI